MKRFQLLAEKRFKWLDKNQDSLFDLIRRAEGVLYKELLGYILELDIDDKGNLKQTSKNVKTLIQVNKIVDNFNKTKNVGIITRIVENIKDLLGLNKEYFDTVAKGLETSVEQKARQSVMLSIGYDEVKNQVIEGGYLFQLSKGGDIAGSVAIKINQAIIGKLPLKQFQKQFLGEFVSNADGLGVLERYYKTFAFDLYQRVDRQVQIQYADELDLQFFLYFGSKIATTRSFCEKRYNKLYTRKFAEKDFKNDPFIKKSKFADTYQIVQAGLFNCRHSINFISNELGEELAKTEGINEYRAVTPKAKDKKKTKSIFS